MKVPILVYVVVTILIFLFLLKFSSNKCFPQRGDESYKFFHPIDTQNFPQNSYSPYFFEDSGAWPLDMYSKFRYDYPSFSSGSGWSYNLRPGVHYGDWSSGTWVRHNDDHYFINNGNNN